MMKKFAKVALAGVVALSLTGCAVKQYPQAGLVTSEESTLYTCHDVTVELSKANATKKDIENIGRFDARTVLGFLGDFGIGNGIAKNQARTKANARVEQLESLKAVKCENAK